MLTLMKRRIMGHFIWVITVCQSTCLGVSGPQRVKEVQKPYSPIKRRLDKPHGEADLKKQILI